MSLLVLLVAVALGGAFPAAAGELPAVARPSFRVEGRVESGGIVFFIPAPSKAGVAAVGTAHAFDLHRLVRATQVGFTLGHSQRLVALSRGFLVPPGQPFNAAGATLRDDFVVYALEGAPVGARVLEPDTGQAAPGAQVRLLGVPSSPPHDEDEVFGRVVSVTPEHIEADLDVPYDLRGWGGAPVLSSETGRVIGILQAHQPKELTARVFVSPIDAVVAALQNPLEGGAGHPFARFAEQAAKQPPPPGPPRAQRAADTPSRRRDGAGSSGLPQPLIRQAPTEETRIHLEIEYPPDGAVVTDSTCGLFVTGRALALHGELRRFDVVLVLDTSRSTIDPTGADINGNGIVGEPRLGRLGSIFSAGSTDAGDSILAAEVAAARQLLRGLDPRTTRVAVVAFAGDPPDAGGGLFSRGPRRPAYTLEPLTSEFRRAEAALDDILSQEPEGATHMAAGVDQATIELMGLRGALSTPDPLSEKIVFFFTDGQPTLPYGPGFDADNIRAVLRAATRASRGGVRIHSFAIGPDALKGPIATVEMATRTNGYFTPVRHPGDLVAVVDQVSFANLSNVTLHNSTTGEAADPFRSTADGSWSGLVSTVPGINRIEVIARADDGTEARETIDVRLDPEAPAPTVPQEFAVKRNRLLEDCLRNIKRVRLSTEAEHAERVRKDLRVEIERERRNAQARAEEQRKRLDLEVEEDE